MKKKIFHRPRFWVVTGVIIAFLFIAAMFLADLPKPLQVSDSMYHLASLEDGVYQGECDNGLVFAEVEVTIKSHTIDSVHLLEHRSGKGQPAEAIINSVISHQSIEVDTVSGATASSQTILKAIENALSK